MLMVKRVMGSSENTICMMSFSESSMELPEGLHIDYTGSCSLWLTNSTFILAGQW